MFNCADEVLRYHDKKVTLPTPEQTEMRQRRNANRDRLKKGLKDAGKAQPLEFRSQGSYAMKTMVQHPDKDYDIDDGVYFDKAVLVGARGAELSALQARQLVRGAIDDGSFKTAPEVRNNCVRVYYEAGFHVDLPVYRRVEQAGLFSTTHYYELASADWKRSDARKVKDWFDSENVSKSPNEDNGGQLRRVVRLIKKFSKSRSSWEKQILSGFGITVLAAECYSADRVREDVALYNTMKAMRDRLNWNLVVSHPTTPGETITSSSDDARARFLRDRLSEGLETLKSLSEYGCTREQALKAWDRLFGTKFFIEQTEKAASLLKAASAAPASIFGFPAAPRVDTKPRGFA